MIIPEDPCLRASQDDPVLHAELDDMKLIFYVVCIVFAGALLILIGCVIGLFAWIQKLSIAQKKNVPAFSTRSLGRTLKPDEELAKRYTITRNDIENFNRNSTLDHQNPLSNQPGRPEPDVLGNARYNSYKHGPGSSKQPKPKHPDRRSDHSSVPADGMHFVEDRLRDDLYY